MTKILPEEFIQQTQKLMGEEMFAQLSDAICHSEPPTSIRLNRFKAPQGTHLADNSSTDAEAEVKTHNESEKRLPKEQKKAKERQPLSCLGVPTMADTLQKGPTSPSTHSSMPVCIMPRKPLPCLSTSW